MNADKQTRAALRTLAMMLLVTATAAGQLVADFSADVTSGANPLTVSFSDASTGGTPSAWTWDFGDGASSSLAAPVHTYTAPGSYDVRLTVLAGLFSSDTEVKPGFIQVDPAPQVTAFEATPTSGSNPLTVEFSDTSSGAVSGWLWDFGDGGSSTEQNPQHTFTVGEGGGVSSYSVALTTFVGGQSQTVVEADLISVSPAPLQADFSAVVTSGTNPLQVQFIDRSLGAVEAWHWDFGDGGTHDVQHGFHIFSVQDDASTSWDVTLTVSIGGQQSTLVKPAYITVEPAVFELGVALGETEGVGSLVVDFDDVSELPPGTQVSWDVAGQSFQDSSGSLLLVADADGPTSHDVSLTAKLWNQVETLTVPQAITVAPRLLGGRRLVEAADLNGTGAAVIDWDGDGDSDLVAAFGTDDLVAWYENLDGAGSFGAAQTLVAGEFVTVCQAVDLDGDGQLELFLAGPYAMAWLPGGSTGGPLHAFTSVPEVLSYHRLADMDGDGDLDLFARAHDQETVLEWFENLDGVGSLGPPTVIATDDHLSSLEVGDLDGDGDLDVVGTLPALTWFENADGAGAVWTAHPFAPLIDWQDDFLLADLERDGDLDLLVATRLDVGLGGYVAYALNPGDGQFEPFRSTSVVAEQRLDHLAVADLDGDGDDEILATSWWNPAFLDFPGELVWFEDLDGQLGFGEPQKGGPSERLYTGLQTADLDGDGDVDLVTSRNWTGSLHWISNTLRTPSWSPRGPRLAGSFGPPLCQAFGALTAGGEITLALSGALPGSVASLVLGATALDAAFKGGVLVPHPDVVVPFGVNAGGELLVQDTWPAGVADGLPVLLQFWVVDAGAPAGLAASNGLEGVSGS